MTALLPTKASDIEKVGTLSPQFQIPPERLIQGLSYSHIELIVNLDDELKRTFYEVECLRGNWTVRDPYGFEFLGIEPCEA
ncbi:MAG: hypothetical protein NTW97_05780 [Candidatus Krumholzibacteria bacterium]|nr:hypothetical protein [Candidatus Krumholzibacteria bacterium]